MIRLALCAMAVLPPQLAEPAEEKELARLESVWMIVAFHASAFAQ
jgi:hypothetical protein